MESINNLQQLSETITAVATKALETAAENSTSSNWIVDYEDVSELISEEDFHKYFEFIYYEINSREEVLDLVRDGDAFDLILGTDYCKAYEPTPEEGDMEYGTEDIAQVPSMASLAKIGQQVLTMLQQGKDIIRAADIDLSVTKEEEKTAAPSKDIQIISGKEASDILYDRSHSNKGLFLVDGWYQWTAIDNSTGDAWTEDFKNREAAEKWLHKELEADKAHTLDEQLSLASYTKTAHSSGIHPLDDLNAESSVAKKEGKVPTCQLVVNSFSQILNRELADKHEDAVLGFSDYTRLYQERFKKEYPCLDAYRYLMTFRDEPTMVIDCPAHNLSESKLAALSDTERHVSSSMLAAQMSAALPKDLRKMGAMVVPAFDIDSETRKEDYLTAVIPYKPETGGYHDRKEFNKRIAEFEDIFLASVTKSAFAGFFPPLEDLQKAIHAQLAQDTAAYPNLCPDCEKHEQEVLYEAASDLIRHLGDLVPELPATWAATSFALKEEDLDHMQTLACNALQDNLDTIVSRALKTVDQDLSRKFTLYLEPQPEKETATRASFEITKGQLMQFMPECGYDRDVSYVDFLNSYSPDIAQEFKGILEDSRKPSLDKILTDAAKRSQSQKTEQVSKDKETDKDR